MEIWDEEQAEWPDSSETQIPDLRVLSGSLDLSTDDWRKHVHIFDQRIRCDEIESHLLNTDREGETLHDDDDNHSDIWRFKVVSFRRFRVGRLVLSFPQQIYQQMQGAWNLHPRTIEVFLSNNGVFTTFHCSDSGQTSFILKVGKAHSAGSDCISVTCNPLRRTVYVLYHHLENEASVFANLLATPEMCIDPYFFIATLYQSNHCHIETHRTHIDDAIFDIERQTGFGGPGRLLGHGLHRRAGRNQCLVLADPKRAIQQLSYCQTDLATIGHAARCCLDCGEWLIQAIDEDFAPRFPWNRKQPPYNRSKQDQQRQRSLESQKAMRLTIRQDVEHVRRRAVMLSSQLQALRERAQSQTNFMLNTITQRDAEYTAAIAVDGKRDNIAMKTIAVLGIVFLPGTFIATLFSMDMFTWINTGGDDKSFLRVSPGIWIYWAITVPLTAMTFLVWLLWSRRESYESSRRLMTYRTKTPTCVEDATATDTSRPTANEKMV